MTILVIASSNQGKIEEFRKLLVAFPLEISAQPNDLEVFETGSTFLENARIKAITVANATRKNSLGDDSGLCVKALGDAPGIRSARYASNDFKRVAKLLKELESFSDRSAFFSCALCLASPDGKVLFEVEGRCNGLITNTPRGNYGFGYDPIFEVEGTRLTFAEMLPIQKQSMSHRARAFDLLIPGLKETFC